MERRVPIVGGNSNNDANYGAFYFSLETDAANRNWNIEAALSSP